MRKAIEFKIVFSFISLLIAVFCFDVSVAAEDASDEIYYCIDDTAYTVSGNGAVTLDGESITIGTNLTIPGDYLLKFTNDGVSISNHVYLWKAGNVYADSEINVLDLVAAKESEFGIENATKSGTRAADINSDGVIDSEDLMFVRKMLLGDEAFTKFASIATDEGTTYYSTLTEAMDAANTLGGVGNQETVEIMLHRDVTIDAQINIGKNITILNASGKKITIKRDSTFTGTMFDVNTDNVTFTLGRNEENVQDMLIVDGSSESAIGGRIVFNEKESSTFVLCKNTTLTGARSTLMGAAFANLGAAYLYGNMTDNGSSSNGGAINHASSSQKLYIYSGNYSNNVAILNAGGVIYNSMAGGIVIEGGTFTENQASKGGVIYCTYFPDAEDRLTINGGTFENNQATNNADSGGAIYLYRTKAKITSGTFVGNKAKFRGGAIQCNAEDGNKCELVITGGTFTKNESELQGGGAISLINADADISGVTMRNNICGGTDTDNFMGGGAILIQKNSQVTLSDCEINDNTAAGTEVDDGYDIGFRGEVNANLILNDSSFNGSLGWLFGNTPPTVKIHERLENIISDPITLKRGSVCTVDYTSGMLVSPYYEYSDIVYDRSLVDGKFACYFIRGDVGMNTFENNTVSGDSTLLIAPDGTTMLIDCNMTSTAGHVVAALKRLGIEKIDYFVCSHAHGDHIGGWPTLLRYFDIGRVYITGSLLYNAIGNEYVTGFLDALTEKDIPYSTMDQGAQLDFGGVDVDVLWPGSDTDWKTCEPDDSTQNNYSAVIKVTYNNSTFLFGGDIEEATENALIEEYGSTLHADIVKMNHHGQFYTSEKNAWLDTVQAKVAVAEHYAVHSEERVQRYTKRGIVPLFTGLDKTCLVYTSGDGTYDVQVEKDRCYYTVYLPSMTDGHFKVGTSGASITGNTVNYLQDEHLMLHGGNNASNEDELRKLLRSDEDITITITGDIDVHRELVVYGKKKIQGTDNAKLTMWLAATDEQAVITIPEGVSLEMENVSIDGNGVSDGIHVEEGGELLYSSGTISYSAEYGVKCQGTAELKDISMDNALHTGIYSENGGKVYLKDCSMNHARRNFVYVEKGGYAEITGNSVFEKSICRGFWNEGTLIVKGEDVSADQEKSIQILDTYVAFFNQEDGNVFISGVEVDTSSRSAVYALSGTVSVADSLLIKQENAAIQAGGKAKVTISDTAIEECQNAGVYVAEDSEVEFWGITTIKNCRHGIHSHGGTVTGEGVRINTMSVHGIAATAQSDAQGTVTLSDVQVLGAGNTGLYAENGILNITDGTVSDCTDSGVKSITNANITLTDVTVEKCKNNINVGNTTTCTINGESVVTSATEHGVFVAGTFIMNSGSIHNNNTTVNGAGMYVESTGAFTMTSGSFYENETSVHGGAIFANGGIVEIKSGEFYNNKATQRGGVIYLTGTADVDYNLTIEGGTFRDNSAEGNPYGGGVMYLESTTALISGGTFYSNDSKFRGGAIQTNGTTAKMCQLKITGGIFTYNESKLQGGGTIGLCHTTADISGVIMQNNFCSSSTTENYMGGGAILIQENAQVTLSECKINDNTKVGTTDNKGYDIGFKADANSKLILNDTSFDGLIGLDFGSTAGKVVVLGGSEITVSKGIVYTVDYTNKCLSPES